ncbi:permease prefix domain 1-containing protein [Clostridium estertheticum]|nr:permease prefix domain 1-containing protein [Clostridium estertheticum]MBZ9614297.1 permease prefix domain 1-containing protein [Clostridium estertheticum subsp. laramiense]WAG75946.1 permease prefix domain 1-containing protein [Clostridium estertheticum]
MKDFKNEMKANLLSSVDDLLSQGYEEINAVELAIKRFGEVDSIKTEIKEVYKTKYLYAKKLLNITIIVGVLGILLSFGGGIWKNYSVDRPINDIYSIIEKNMGNGSNPITDNMKNNLKDKVDKSFAIDYVTLQIFDKNDKYINTDTNLKYDYNYAPRMTIDEFGNGRPKTLLRFVAYAQNSKQIEIKGSNKGIIVITETRDIGFMIFQIVPILLLIYWVLFAIWASINSVNNKRSIIWIFVFILLNVVGYLIYYLDGHSLINKID